MLSRQFRTASDAELVALSIDGQKNAFGEIVHRYQGIVTGLIYSRCQGRISQSEDLAQDTFVIAWQKLATLDQSDRLSAWLCGIAKNVVRSAVRKRTEHASEKVADLAVDASEPISEAISREQEALLWSSLERIPEKYREPMVLFYRQDQSVEQVAKALELTSAAVRKRLERGRAMLRDDMAAVVEDKLGSTAPDPRFASGVLAALPVLGGKATVTTAGKVSMASVGGTKLSGVLAVLAGPFIGILGGLFGTYCTIRGTRSPREREFAIRQSVNVWLFVVGFVVLMLTWLLSRPLLPSAVFWPGVVLLCLAYSGVLLAGVVRFNRRQRQIRIEDGTHDSRPISTVELGAQWRKPGQVYGVFGGSIGGALAWTVAMAVQAKDWWWAGAILAVGVLLVVAIAQTVLQKGPWVALRMAIASILGAAAINLVVLNVRLQEWLDRGVESRLVFLNYELPADDPLLLNLVFVGLFGVVLLFIFFHKGLRQLADGTNAKTN